MRNWLFGFALVAVSGLELQGQTGAALYREHCAVCHGVDGKGAGPAAAALKPAPADLTVLARRNDGVFPADRVRKAIEGGSDAHSSRQMPAWGRLLRDSTPDRSSAAQRLQNLGKHLESIQVR